MRSELIVKYMKNLFVGISLILFSGIAYAVELNDLDITIRVIDSDTSSVQEVANELKLPDLLKENLAGSRADTPEQEEQHGDQGVIETKEVRETSDEPHEDLHERESDTVRDIRDRNREREDSDEREGRTSGRSDD